jgi:calcyclin binding protein
MDVDSGVVEELEADCHELRAMLDDAKRPNVRKELQRVLDMLEAEHARQAPKVSNSKSFSASSPADVSNTAVSQPAAKAHASAGVVSKPAPTVEGIHKPVQVDIKPMGPWTEVTTFALDLGGYDKPMVSVDLRLKGVEALPSESVTCHFTESSLDLKVLGLDGLNYRFLKTNLDKDIVPAESSVKVKKNHVIIALQKVKGQYGYDSWTDLCAKGRRRPNNTEKSKETNPQDSIMGMMRDLYEDGDDNMKKIIGEAMCKAQRGEKYDPKTEDLNSTPSLGSMDDL